MNEIVSISIVMEMLAINLFTVDACATRKRSGAVIFTALLIFTAVLTAPTHGLWDVMGFNEGNAVFSLIGVIYLLPLSFLYREPLRRILSILFSAWIYTMAVYCMSVRIAYLFPPERFILNVLSAQSLLYAATIYFFIRWIKGGFLFVLRNLTQNNRYFLQLISLVWFGAIIIVNAALIYPDNSALKMASILVVTANALLSYLLIYFMVKSGRQVQDLEGIVYIDSLTGLYNRARLFKDAGVLIKKKVPFRLIFIDLNQFKSVNDQFGHLTGDHYLVSFAQATRDILSETDVLYRMSGDEFIIISRARDFAQLTERLGHYPEELPGLDIPFRGCGVGWADYPAEEVILDKLISLADHRMYEDKYASKHNGG